MNFSFDQFIETATKVKIIYLDRNTWAKSKCNCGWFLKNYFFYHIIITENKYVEQAVKYFSLYFTFCLSCRLFRAIMINSLKTIFI